MSKRSKERRQQHEKRAESAEQDRKAWVTGYIKRFDDEPDINGYVFNKDTVTDYSGLVQSDGKGGIKFAGKGGYKILMDEYGAYLVPDTADWKPIQRYPTRLSSSTVDDFPFGDDESDT